MSDISIGFCQCGCGRKTNLASRSDKRDGTIKGQPVRYISGHNALPLPAETRFWQNVDKRGPDECWLWKGYKNHKGYGSFGVKGRNTVAHRFAYELVYGPIPPGLFALHRCDVSSCCNPAHIFLGTLADNNHDMWQKGRYACGEQNGSHKLTADQVREIRRLASLGLTQEVIAQQFHVSRSHVSFLAHRKQWAHLD